VQWLSIFKVMLQHNAINNILPFRLGELSFPILLKQRENIGLASSAKTLITARLFDFLVMGMAAFGVLMLILNNNQRLVFISVMILVALVGGIGLVFVLKKSQRIHDIFSRFYTYLIANFKSCSAITLAIWLFKILGLAALLSPMLNTEIELALLAVLVVEGTAILPINGPANFGSLEGAVVAILLPFGLVAGEVFGAVLNLHLAIIMLAAIGYLASFLIPNTHHS